MGSRAWRILLAVAILGGVVGLAFYSGLRRRCPLHLPEEQKQLGQLWEQTLSEVAVDLRNAGAEAYHITGFRNDCNCIEFTPANFSLAPGAQQRVTMSIRPVFQPKQLNPDGSSQWDMILEPSIADRPRSEWPRWRLKGHVGRLFKNWTAEFAIVGAALSGKPSSVSIPYQLAQPLQNLTVDNPNPWLVAVLVPSDDLTGHLKVTFHEYAIGYHQETIRLKGKLTDGTPVNSPPLRLMGTAEHLVQLDPPQVFIGIVPVGQEVEATVAVRTAAGVVLNEFKYEIPPCVVKVHERPLPNGRELRLKIKLTKPGALQEALQLHLGVNSRARKELSLAILCHGGGK